MRMRRRPAAAGCDVGPTAPDYTSILTAHSSHTAARPRLRQCSMHTMPPVVLTISNPSAIGMCADVKGGRVAHPPSPCANIYLACVGLLKSKREYNWVQYFFQPPTSFGRFPRGWVGGWVGANKRPFPGWPLTFRPPCHRVGGTITPRPSILEARAYFGAPVAICGRPTPAHRASEHAQ